MGPGKFIGGVTQMLTAPLHYICASAVYFFRVGLCPHGNYLCRTRGATRGVEFDCEEEGFINQDTCLKNLISERDQRAYLVTRGAFGASDRHRGLIKDSSDMAHRTIAIFRDSGDRGAPCGSRL